MWSKKKIFASIAVFYVVQALLAVVILTFAGSDTAEQLGVVAHGRSLLQRACNTSDSTACGTNGRCQNTGKCKCDGTYIFRKGKDCSYKSKSKLVAFLLSFFVGSLGVDWFYLANGNAGYIVAGVFKLLSGGCCAIWWLVDWIRILAGGFKDGNDVGLFPDM